MISSTHSPFENLDATYIQRQTESIISRKLKELVDTTVAELIRFHKACFIDILPQIEVEFAALERLAAPDRSITKGLAMAMDFLKSDLRAHFAYEEKHLYPYALGLASGDTSISNFDSAQFELEHPQIRLDLGCLISIVEQYSDDFRANFAYRILHGRLLAWQAEMNAHEALEDDVLLSAIRQLEEQSRT